ncbi:hypothetical protein PG997_006662 [Apiospora hydei]|uniref:Heterokaryon incompatibility domain-containing protein n=1 Tax=Apiospora hydei TaxID=1337664 RepID=A0ABR1WPD8_9PEZI
MQFTVASLILISAASIAASPVAGSDNTGRVLSKRGLVGYTEDGQVGANTNKRALLGYAENDETGQAIGRRDVPGEEEYSDEADEGDDGMVLLRRDERGNGTGIEYFGVDPYAKTPVTPTRTIERRGPKCTVARPTPSCDTKKNQAQNKLCDSLMADLSAQSDLRVDKSWRKICYLGESGKCCTAWSNEVSGLRQGDLTKYAQRIMESCAADGISGKVYGVWAAGVCINQSKPTNEYPPDSIVNSRWSATVVNNKEMDVTTAANAANSLRTVIGSGIDDEKVPVFAYQPLSPGSNIRILELQPSIDPSAPLEAKLVGANIRGQFSKYSEFDYEANFDYEAISHCWGEPLFTEPLILRGGVYSHQGAVKYITANLRDALLRFRDHGRVRRLWVDAICIDQGNDAEKTTQIGYMTDIYQQASGVLIWLGHSAEGGMDKLEDYDDLECADDKDHLFAISGLATDNSRCTDCRHEPDFTSDTHDDTCMVKIEVNYRKSTDAVYMDAVSRLIIANPLNASRILAMVAKRSTWGKSPNPSWAVDWRLPIARKSLWADRTGYFPGAFGDIQSTQAAPEKAKLLILCHDFVAWGRVATVLNSYTGTSTDEEVMDWLRETWKCLLQWVHDHNPGVELCRAKKHLLLEQLLDVLFVLPHDLTNYNHIWHLEYVDKSVRAYIVSDIYTQLNGEDRKSVDELSEAYDVYGDEESAALTIMGDIQIMVQRIMTGRALCIVDPFTYDSARVNGMNWPGLGIAPNHTEPGDIAMSINTGWKDRYDDQPSFGVPDDMKSYSLQYVDGAENSMMLGFLKRRDS